MQVSVFTKLMAFFQVFVARAVSAFFNGIKLGVLTVLISSFSVAALAQDDDDDDDGGGGGATHGDLTHNYNFQRMDGMHSRLKPHGESLMGDSIDPKTGAITFNHTDVSLPGNFELDVSLRRRIAQGPHPYSPFQEGFADWDIDIPIAYSMYGVPNHQHQAPRASGGCMTFSGDAGTTSTVFAGSGSQTRVELDFPDHGEGVVLHIPGAGLSGFPNRNNILSDPKNNWLSAPQTTDFAGRCATVTIAPNGTKYKFGRHAIRSAPVASIPSLFRGSIDTLVALKRNYFVHLITEVEDVNGNWVRYDYTNNGRSELTRIYSSDGRDIRINYRPEVLNPLYDNSRRVESVTANGRRWSYSYDGTALGTTHRLGKLKTATLPDGRYWDFNMNAMHYVPHMGYQCRPYVGTQNLKHPDGATGTFQLRETRHLKSSAGKQRNDFAMVPRDVPHGNAQTHPGCNTAFAANRRPYGLPFYQAMSVAWKRIEGPGIPTATWTFDYHDYTGGQIDTTWSRVTDPYGTQTTRTYRASGDQTTRGVIADSTMGAGHGLLERVDIVPETGAGETIRYEYDLLNNRFRGLFSCLLEVSESAPLGACESFNYRPVTKTVRTRDSDVYTTESTYSKNASDFVDHGYPNIVQRYSNIQGSTTPRIVTKTYKHIKGKNIIGLPAKVTQNGLEVSTYTYDAFGRKTAQTRYGKPYMTFGYHGAAAYKGALHWVRDALGRTTYLLNYKRGTPQQVKRPDNTSHFTYVDNNGWTTSQKDPLGRTTNYTHDNMGRLKTIDPTGNFWSVTAIGYTFPPSGGAVQTITRGSSLTTITYDAMYRATLEHVRDLGSNWQSFVNTKYDALGRTIFTSQPSTNPSETKGVDTTYDGLGRVTQSRENVAPFATTKYSYHGSHRRRTTDPSGAWTDHYGYGYEGPGSDDYRAIYHYADGAYQRYTYLYKNVRGQMTRLRQWGHTQGGLSIDKSQNFYYDAQQRLCRHYVPEHGATKYQYDAAGQMTAYAKGQSNSGCGTVPNSAAKVSLTYDKLGRVTKTDFADAGTPDILKTYDANSNVKTVNRGGVNWTYAYNDYDLLTAETLRLDGRTFPMNYVYNSEGQMTRRKLPTNRWVDYTLDGLGRTTDVTSASVRLASNTNFHTSGAVTAMNYGNGQRFTQTLNARLLPQRMRAVKGSTVALDLDYLYDPRGKITRMTDRQNGNNTRNYKYDGLGQLIEAKAPFWGTASYTYDSLGNIRQKKVGARTIDMIYDAKNRLSRSIDTGETKTRWIAYDARGNTSALGAMKFIYDYADQPVRVTGSAGGIDGAAGTVDGRYTYDGNLKRVKSVVNGKTIYNVYDASGGLLHVHELTGNKKTDYVNGPLGSLARYTNNVVTYLHGDHLGSPRATTNGAGAINGWGAYTPFGEEWSANLPDDQAGFTGHIKDSTTGLNYMQARYYDPVIGRFLSIDPVTFMDTGNPAHFNRYAYGNNDPVNMIDPDGRVAQLHWTASDAVTVTIPYAIDESQGKAAFSPAVLDVQINNFLSGDVNIGGTDIKVTTQGKNVPLNDPGVANGTVNVIKIDPSNTRAHANDIGGNQITANPKSSSMVGAHELGHSAGAGDQYNGGVDANRNRLTADVPGPQNIMRDLGGRANSQSLTEIVTAPTNSNTCSNSVSSGNGTC